MGLLRDLIFGRTPPPLALDAAPVETDAEHPAGGYHPFWNSLTGLGSDRDPQSSDEARWAMSPLHRPQVETLVRMDGLAARICGMAGSWLTQHGPRSWTVLDATRRPTPWAARGAALHVQDRFAAAQTAANELGDAVLWMVVEERGAYQPDRQDRPVDLAAVTGIRSLILLRKSDLLRPILQTEIDDEIPYGEPVLYPVVSHRGGRALTLRIHASRILHFQGTPLSGDTYLSGTDGWGADSLLQQGMGVLSAISASRLGRKRASDRWATWWAKTRFPSAGSAAAFLEALQKRWAALRAHSSLGLAVLAAGTKDDPGEDIIQLNAPMSGSLEIDTANLRDLSLCYGWPPEVFGAGPLVSSLGRGSDVLKVMSSIMGGYFAARWEPLLRRFYDILYAAQSPSGDIPEYTIQLAPLDAPSATDRATARARTIDGWAKLIEIGALDPATVRRTIAQGWSDELQPAAEDQAPEPAQDAAPSREATLIALAQDPGPIAATVARVRAILPDLAVEDWPHVTLLYLGDVPSRSMPAIERATVEHADDWPDTLIPVEIGPLGDPGADGQAIVLFLRSAGLQGPQSRLLRALAPETRARQFPAFRPHITLGYARNLTDEQAARLSAIQVPESLPAGPLVLRRGDADRLRFAAESYVS